MKFAYTVSLLGLGLLLWFAERRLYRLDFKYFLPVRIFVREYIAIAPAVWRHSQNTEWADLLDFWAWHLERMAKYTEEYGHHVGSDKDARDQRRIAWVLRELAAERRWAAPSYNWEHHPVLSVKAALQLARSREEQAADWAFRLFVKRFRGWWE